jgi:hypothetical protein
MNLWQQSNVCSDWISECSDLTHMKFPNCSQLLLFLRIGSFNSFTLSALRLTEGCPWHLASSTEVTPLSNLTEKLVFFHCLLSKSLNILKVFVKIFPTWQQNLIQSMSFFQVYHFQGTPKSQMGQHILVMNKLLLNNVTCYSLTVCWKWSDSADSSDQQ